jgi:hypothetical protein
MAKTMPRYPNTGLRLKGGDHLADDAEGRQNHDVDLGMTEEPEQVLVQERIAAALRVEEGGAEIAIGEQHGQRSREHRHCEQDQERGHQDRPYEQRHPKKGHSRRTPC